MSLFTQVLHSNTFVKRDFEYVCKHAQQITFVFLHLYCAGIINFKNKTSPNFLGIDCILKNFLEIKRILNETRMDRNTVRK